VKQVKPQGDPRVVSDGSSYDCRGVVKVIIMVAKMWQKPQERRKEKKRNQSVLT
jgi:hypothetical protein